MQSSDGLGMFGVPPFLDMQRGQQEGLPTFQVWQPEHLNRGTSANSFRKKMVAKGSLSTRVARAADRFK